MQDSLGGVGSQGNGVAVLLAGTLVRYFPNLDEHVVAPLVQANRAVDVYLSLSVEGFHSWRHAGNQFVMHPAYVDRSLDEVKDMIAEGIRDNGGTAAVIRMPHKVNLTPGGLEFRKSGHWWDKDPTTKGPQDLDVAWGTRGNVAKLYLELRELWNIAKENEKLADKSYKYVMIFRDDSNWLSNFDMDRMLRIGGKVMLTGSAGHAWGQQCGPQGLPRLCDFVVVAEREVAEPFGSFYTLMIDPKSMGVPWLDPRAESVLEGERYMYQVAHAFKIHFEQVPTALIPFERCGRMNKSGHVIPCRHKPNDNSFHGVAKMGAMTRVPGRCDAM
jgi:hypothetical protein